MISGLILLIPLLGILLVMLSKNPKVILRNALLVSFAELIMVIFTIISAKNIGIPEMQFNLDWMPELGVNFSIALDGISLSLVLLTAFLSPIILWSVRQFSGIRPNIFFGLILASQFAMTATFMVQDGLMFYIFWELALIPVYFITAIWGGENRIRITFKFFIYTLTGSLMMLVALVYLYFQTPVPHSFEFESLYKAVLDSQTQMWIFGAFFLAFAIKIPIFPFHTWQPDTYTIAPFAGSMLLAGIMLKMGIYGIIRFILPICPIALDRFELPVIIISIVGIVYASIIAIKQDDLKRFVAYVSIAHVGLIAAGVFAANTNALQGAVFQMFSHGVNVVGLFLIIQIIEEKTKNRNISSLGGLIHVMPRLSILFMIILLGSIALPLTNGFVGEYLLLLGIFSYNPILALVAGSTIIFGAIYMLRMYQKVMLGEVNSTFTSGITDIDRNEMLVLIPICIIIIVMGVYPQWFINIIQPSVNHIINIISTNPN